MVFVTSIETAFISQVNYKQGERKLACFNDTYKRDSERVREGKNSIYHDRLSIGQRTRAAFISWRFSPLGLQRKQQEIGNLIAK